jgi:hypothetical protein
MYREFYLHIAQRKTRHLAGFSRISGFPKIRDWCQEGTRQTT